MSTIYRQFIPIVVLGNSDVGKTSLITQYTSQQFNENTLSTIGYEFKIKNINVNIDGKEKTIKLKIWDTAGQEKYREQILVPLKNCLGAIILYDITNNKSFESVKEWIDLIDTKKDIKSFPLILVANKIDLNDSRIINYDDGKNLADKHNFPFYEICASQNINVEETFKCLVDKIIEIYKKDFINDNDGSKEENFELKKNKVQKESGCCAQRTKERNK